MAAHRRRHASAGPAQNSMDRARKRRLVSARSMAFETGRPTQQLLPFALSLALLAPSGYWISRDRSVWSWDPAFYATDTVDLWYTLAHFPGAWLERMKTIFWAKAPAIGWLGQFFVPIGRWMGSVETGLLLSVLLVQLCTLVLTFRMGRRLATGSTVPAALATLLVASGPLFVAMSHHYLTEALQTLAVTYVYCVAVQASSAASIRTLLHLLLALAIGIVAKVSTPAYVLFPALVAVVRALRRARLASLRDLGWQDAALA